MAEKFKRIYRELKGAKNEPGRIQVKIILLDEDKGRRYCPQKGNITRQVLLDHARVSDVYDAIEEALFAGEASH